ncbi:MAG: hypothetical protein KJS45_06585 [Bacteroidetes bacterium]|nr:hypothetical protein [Bacteroidota bacterium]GDX48460.1 hypothetical protein LBMAG25_12780 [Bacteroidota bacterium]
MDQILQENERILWRGNPKQGILVRDLDILAIPMSIMLFGFSVILDFAILHFKASYAFLSLAFLLNVMFLYLGVFRFILNARRRRNQEYAITNKRIIVSQKTNKSVAFKTLPFRNIEGLDLTLEKDGFGFITFGNINPVLPWLFGGYVLNGDKLYGLDLVPDAQHVFDLINAQSSIEIEEPLVPLVKLKPSQNN